MLRYRRQVGLALAKPSQSVEAANDAAAAAAASLPVALTPGSTDAVTTMDVRRRGTDADDSRRNRPSRSLALLSMGEAKFSDYIANKCDALGPYKDWVVSRDGVARVRRLLWRYTQEMESHGASRPCRAESPNTGAHRFRRSLRPCCSICMHVQ